MRIRGNCLVLIFSCFFFIILSNVAKILYVNYVYLPNPTALPQSQQKHPPQSQQNLYLFLRKRCRVDNLKNCIQNTSTTLWVDIEIPVDGEYTPWTEPSEVGTPSSSSENKTINQQVQAFLDAKNLSQNAVELEAPAPPGYIEVGRLHPKKEKKKIKIISGPLYLDNPHSPERLRNRLKSFPNNSEMLTFVKRQEDRKWFELEYCARFNKDKNNKHLDRHAYDSIIIDREYCITFCPIYKAASTSWLVNLLTLKGMWKPGKERPKIQLLVTHAFQRVSTLAAPWASKGTTKFTIVRHPFHRLISCYRDKFRDARKLYYYQRYGEKMVRAFRPLPNGISSDEIQSMVDEVRRILNSSEASETKYESLALRGNIYANPIGPTFEEFVKFVVSFKHDDEHWRPFYIQCSICQVQYDFVLRSENLSSDSKLFAEYLNQTSVIETGWENPTSDGATNEDRVCEYFKEIDNRLFEKLISKYKVDFDLFHYEADSYRKCVKDYKPR